MPSFSPFLRVKPLLGKLVRLFPFLLPSKAPSFQGVQAWITTRCNLKCKFCYKTVIGTPFFEMSKETFCRIAESSRHVGLTLLGLGEPLLHPNFREFVEIWKTRVRGPVGFSTNGTLIDDEMARELVKIGVDEIVFSIDGMNRTYEEIRKGSDFELVLENIKQLHHLKGGRKARPTLGLTFVGLTENIEQFPMLLKLLSPFVTHAKFNHVAPYSREIAALHLFRAPRGKVVRIFNEARRIAKENNIRLSLRPLEPFPDRACEEPWTSPYVTPDGTVYPCCILGDHHRLQFMEYFEDSCLSYNLEQYAMGNVMEQKQNLKEIWNNDRFKAFRARLLITFWKTRSRRYTVEEYVRIRERGSNFFCDICSLRWGCVC
ncbi:MAG: radical SAM protein [Candidatus Hadarchaeales archaeon]